MTKSKKKFVCKYCKRAFSKESTLASHMCEKKKRYLEKDSLASRLGFRLFQRFYELTTQLKRQKTFDEFINNNLYLEFVKFGRHIIEINALQPEQFAEFVFKTGVKLKDWRKEYVYETFLEDLLLREPVDSALERAILYMNEWSEETGNKYNEYFLKATTFEAVHAIKSGKISPWILYTASTSEYMLNSLSIEQVKMIDNLLNPGVWSNKLRKQDLDTFRVKEVLHEAGI